MKEKCIYLFKNAGLLFISSFASKVLVFILVPLYTSILSAKEYGTYDLLYTTVQMLAPILSFNVLDAVIRFSIGESKEEQKKTFIIGLRYTFFSVLAIVVISGIAKVIFPLGRYITYIVPFIFLFTVYTFNNLINQFARGIDDVRGVAIAGVIGTLAMIFFNILFLIWMRWGIYGYFYAMILSMAIPALYLVIRDRMWRYVSMDLVGQIFSDHEKEMLRYGLPLIFITLSWYINNVSDRYVVTLICGIEANGIYSVSYKIPAILNAVQTVFIQAWQLSAIKEYSSKDGAIFYSKMYQGYHIIMTLLCSCLICSTRILAKILFANEFYGAWIYVPVLLLYIVFNTMSGVVGGVFSASKQSKALAISAITGAVTNIILNVVLVYLWGPMGAAIATVISSVVIWTMRMWAAKRYIELEIRLGRHFTQYMVLVAQIVFFICIKDNVLCYVMQTVMMFILVYMLFWEARSIVEK